MKLSRTVGYALQATLQLAEADPTTPIPCSQLASQGQMPERFLLQILRNLVTHGILHSTRGVDGGYALERPANEISLLDLIEAVDGPVFGHAPLADGLPQELVDQLSTALKEVSTVTRKQLSSIKLSSLLSPGRKVVEQK
ncbi:MAG TPA: Rrf2 family transcriptional regulator [Pirellulales bacterium]|jgi:Rrf2 family protein